MITRTISIIVLVIFFSQDVYSQKGKKKNRNINFSSSLNYYPPLPAYKWQSSYRTAREDIDLTFLTQNSGIFEVELDTISVYSERRLDAPSTLIGLGMSLQIKNMDNVFQEFSIPRLNFQKVDYLRTVRTTYDSTGYTFTYRDGSPHTSFAFAFRYELGKYFGDPFYSKIQFGMSASVESSLLFYSSNSNAISRYPINGHIIDFNFALIPSLQCKLSSRIALDLKAVPYFLIGSIENVREENPVLTSRQGIGTRDEAAPKFNFAMNVHLRYTIRQLEKTKKGKKRKRRKKRR